jgi:hypothetical protein
MGVGNIDFQQFLSRLKKKGPEVIQMKLYYRSFAVSCFTIFAILSMVCSGKGFIDYILSPDGTALCQKHGYLPLKLWLFIQHCS